MIKKYVIGLGGKKKTIGVTFVNNMTMDQLNDMMKNLNAKTFRRAPAMNYTSMSYSGAAFDFSNDELVQNAKKILDKSLHDKKG